MARYDFTTRRLFVEGPLAAGARIDLPPCPGTLSVPVVYCVFPMAPNSLFSMAGTANGARR